MRLIEHRPQVLAHIHRELPTELVYEGNATDPRTLELAGLGRGAGAGRRRWRATPRTSRCASSPASASRSPRTIATINDPRNAWLFDAKFRVDVALNQSDILASLIEQEMSLGDMMTLLKLRRGSHSLVSETLLEGARAVGLTIQELPLPRSSVICAILRGGEVVIPRGNVRLEAGDDVLALVDEASAPELAALFGPPRAAG